MMMIMIIIMIMMYVLTWSWRILSSVRLILNSVAFLEALLSYSHRPLTSSVISST